MSRAAQPIMAPASTADRGDSAPGAQRRCDARPDFGRARAHPAAQTDLEALGRRLLLDSYAPAAILIN
jgi:hypothetical protein